MLIYFNSRYGNENKNAGKQKMSIVLPSEEELFYQIMLTVDNVWDNKLSKKDIEKWLCNFNGAVFPVADERRLALYVLSSFVYYNENEVRHLCRTLFSDYLHWMLLHEEDGNSDVERKLDSIVYTSSFCPLGKPGESGAFVLYYFRQENNIGTKQMSDALHPPSYTKTVVLVDDVTISGDQANAYVRMADKSKRNVLLTFIASKDATEVLCNNGIQVISCITLDERSKFFSNDANLYRDFRSSFEDCKRFAEEYGAKSMTYQEKPVEPLGYKNSQYAFGFFYNTPDNSLPIFWADNQGWTPIMKRYEKFEEVPYREFPRFV